MKIKKAERLQLIYNLFTFFRIGMYLETFYNLGFFPIDKKFLENGRMIKNETVYTEELLNKSYTIKAEIIYPSFVYKLNINNNDNLSFSTFTEIIDFFYDNNFLSKKEIEMINKCLASGKLTKYLHIT